MQRDNPVVKAFYDSRAWKQTRLAYYKSKCGVCERCGTCNGKMIVHHKTYINELNVHDSNITLNFDNLELLCLDCHNKEHFGNEINYSFDAEGNLIRPQ